MTVRRKLAVIAAVGVAPLLLAGLTGAPAVAHGAPDNPVSRAAACGPQGRQTNQSAACRAAVAAGAAVEQWDNVRVAGVAGRDRQMIPDGKLCSGGIGKFKGLDLARGDWPATRLSAGADFTFTYRTTIPHQGTFRLYLTKESYDPTRPLAWSDLPDRPFLTATDPPLADGEYRMRGKLPTGRTGRQLIYTIWQNSSTPDTYYSCSDVVFGAAAAAAHPTSTRPARTASASPASTAASTEPLSGLGSAAPVASVSTHRQGMPLLALGAVVLAAVLLVLAGGWFRSRRVRRPVRDTPAGTAGAVAGPRPAPRLGPYDPDHNW